ncbi:MAG: hypothetical protein ABEH90_09200 [Halolamina sp.]
MSDDDRETTDNRRQQPMTDDTENGMEQLVDEESADDHGETAPDSEGSWTGDSDIRRKLNYALLAGLSLLALIAALQFYLNASAAINQWVTREYRSLFQAVFNLAVLLIAAAGISRQVQRLTA